MKIKIPLTIKIKKNKICIEVDGITYVVGSKVLLDPELSDQEIFDLLRRKVEDQLKSVRIF